MKIDGEINILSEILELSKTDQKKSIDFDKLNSYKNANLLYSTSFDILIFCTQKFNTKIFDSLTINSKYNYLNSLLQKEITNPFLIKNKKIYNKWIRTIEIAKVQIGSPNIYSSDLSIFEKINIQERWRTVNVELASEALKYSSDFLITLK